MARNDDGSTTIVDLPFAGGLNQQTSSEWLAADRGQTALVNGNFSYVNSFSKRLGAKLVATQSYGAGSSPAVATPATGLKALSWSRGQMAMAGLDINGSGGLYCAEPQGGTTQFLGSSYKSIGPIPQCRTIRRGLPVVYNNTVNNATGVYATPTQAFAPVILDTEVYRFAFYVEGGQTLGLAINLVTGEPVGVPFVIQGTPSLVITPILLTWTSGVIVHNRVAVLCQIPGSPNEIVGITINNIASPWTSVTVDMPSSAHGGVLCSDIVPYVGDPNGGSFLFLLTSLGAWNWYYLTPNWTITMNGFLATESVTGTPTCTVSATYLNSSSIGSVGMLYARTSSGISGVQFASLSGDHGFSTIAGPVNVLNHQIARTSALTWLPSTSTFMAEWFEIYGSGSGSGSVLSNISAPQGTIGTITPSSGSFSQTGTLPLGFWPVGRPFFVGANMFQPFITQLCTLQANATPGSNGANTSQQCTLYLCQLNVQTGTCYPVSTAAPRQIDPLFSFQYMQFPTGSLPQSAWSGTRFSFGIRTVGNDIPSVGYSNGASWFVDWFFDAPSQSLLYQAGEISGALHIAASTPFVSDGTQTFEDGFFFYPEFANATLAASGVTVLTSGTYGYAVVYVCPDATGALQRSAPVFTPTIVVTSGGFPVIVSFPPMSVSYRNVLYPGSVTAEIYRTQNDSGTFYLIGTTTAYPTTPGSVGLQSILMESGGSGYSFASPPAITIGGGGGGSASAVLGGGGVASIPVTQNGYAYTTTPTVMITGGGGSGATAVAVLGWLPGPTTTGVVSIQITNAGSGYSSPPSAVIVGGGMGMGATLGTPVMTPTTVIGATITAPGSYGSVPSISFGGPGSGATAAAVLQPAQATAQNINFLDAVVTDTELGTSTALYTTGSPGPVDAVNPPSASLQCIHWNRKWIVDETLTGVWFTTAFVTGEAPRFNEALYFSYPDGGDITAIIGMDDKLAIFKLNTISVVYGQGPAINAQGSDLTLPQPIATDSGAIDWRSVVLFPGGLLFQSRTGLMLLDRSLQVSWLGKAVKDLLAEYPVVLSSTLVPSATHVRFVCQASSGSTIVIIYDYLAGAWLTHSYSKQAAPLASATYATVGLTNEDTGATVQTGVLSLVGSDGSMWRETDPINEDQTAAPYMDQDVLQNNYFVPSVVTFSWGKIQGVQGYQRARRAMLLTETLDPSGLTIQIAVNYQSGIVQSASWLDTTVALLPIPQVELHVAGGYNKQQSIQVTVSDFGGTLAVSGQGARFITASLELQRIGNRWPQIATMGRA